MKPSAVMITEAKNKFRKKMLSAQPNVCISAISII